MGTTPQRGSIMLLALVFGAIFLMVFSGLSGYVLVENNFEMFTRAQSEAVAIAEAGLEYYRWHLAHFPTDLQNGTGQPGPYTITYSDPQSGATVGTYTLNITGNQSCGQTTSIDITSTGRPADNPTVSQTLIARYAQPTVAKYDFISNAGVWIGTGDAVHGPYHSNSGVRMDGTSNAPITSSLASWTCTSSFGCSPSQTEPGVFGSGSNQTLWQYPTSQVDFGAIAANFPSLKSIAQSSGIYLPRYSTGNSNSSAYHKGYHLIFNADGTVTIDRVTAQKTSNVGLLDSGTLGNDYALINNETAYETLKIPSACGLIFVEDNTWVSGVIPAQVTLVVANVSNTGVTPDAFLPGNITYASGNGSDGFTLIAQHDILITPDSPQNMTLDGVYVAQSGAFGRNYYGSTSNSSQYEPRGTLTTVGTIVSALQSATTWVNNSGQPIGGYASTIDYPDQQLAQNPPPFTPVLSSDYQFVNWRQQ
ncbi:MAG: hypothetical protein B7X04_02140 [Parcubacteria group bacterium 21-54-25]|nr:MAG: hypothetical protein B7X04_02140 [Parcubacteria group bacterium 21-54-25]HQU07847.1 hypothetical protein [Candidatus Paceibacterota bacterium]